MMNNFLRWRGSGISCKNIIFPVSVLGGGGIGSRKKARTGLFVGLLGRRAKLLELCRCCVAG